MDYNLPVSSVHGILQTRILQWVAVSFSTHASQPPINLSLLNTVFLLRLLYHFYVAKMTPERKERYSSSCPPLGTSDLSTSCQKPFLLRFFNHPGVFLPVLQSLYTLQAILYRLMDLMPKFKFFPPLTTLCLSLATFFLPISTIHPGSEFDVLHLDISRNCTVTSQQSAPNFLETHHHPEQFTFKIINNSQCFQLSHLNVSFCHQEKDRKFLCLAYRVLKYSGNHLSF